MALHDSLRVNTSDDENGQLVKSDELCRRKRWPISAPIGVALLMGLLAGVAVLLTVFSKAHIEEHKTGTDFISEDHLVGMRALNSANKTENDVVHAQLEVHPRDARKTVREQVIKLKSSGKSVEEIKEAGYTKGSLGCKSHKSEAEALESCLEHLKIAFTPLELDELLDMESDHELKMLVDAGVAPKTSGWKKGAEEVVCFTGKKEGCFKRKVSVVSDDKIRLRHLEVDPKTGTTERGDYKFQVYTLEQWEEE